MLTIVNAYWRRTPEQKPIPIGVVVVDEDTGKLAQKFLRAWDLPQEYRPIEQLDLFLLADGMLQDNVANGFEFYRRGDKEAHRERLSKVFLPHNYLGFVTGLCERKRDDKQFFDDPIKIREQGTIAEVADRLFEKEVLTRLPKGK